MTRGEREAQRNFRAERGNVERMRLLQLCQAHSASPAGAELAAVPRHMLQADRQKGQTNRHAVLAIMPGHKDKGSTRNGASAGAQTGAEHALSLAVSS